MPFRNFFSLELALPDNMYSAHPEPWSTASRALCQGVCIYITGVVIRYFYRG